MSQFELDDVAEQLNTLATRLKIYILPKLADPQGILWGEIASNQKKIIAALREEISKLSADKYIWEQEARARLFEIKQLEKQLAACAPSLETKGTPEPEFVPNQHRYVYYTDNHKLGYSFSDVMEHAKKVSGADKAKIIVCRLVPYAEVTPGEVTVTTF